MKIGVFRNYKLENQELRHENYKLKKCLKDIKRKLDNIEVIVCYDPDVDTKLTFKLKKGSKQEAYRILKLIDINLREVEIDS